LQTLPQWHWHQPFGLRPVAAQEAKTAQGTAADLGVMSISLKDVFKSNLPKLRQSIRRPMPGLGIEGWSQADSNR